MPEITVSESLRQVNALTRQAEAARQEGRWEEAAECWRDLLAHPCAHHQVVDYEIVDEIHQVWRAAGRWDEAIGAKREAIAVGFRSTPDPEAHIAECLVEAGRRQEADGLFAELRQRDPDDVWLYNSAAYAYGSVDAREALRWALDGVERALATGDPDGVVAQLLGRAEVAWEAVDEPADADLVAKVEAFCEEWRPGSRRRPSNDEPEPFVDRPCGYCGYEPERSRQVMDEMASRRRRAILQAEHPEVAARLDQAFGSPERRLKLGPEVTLSMAWFPADEWLLAIERWPDLLDELPADHRSYSHAMEGRIKRIAKHLGGRPMHVSPVTVDGLAKYAEAKGEDPGSAEARSAYAAELLRRGEATAWPPGRNEPCLCGSLRKYKQCCGPVPPAPEDG